MEEQAGIGEVVSTGAGVPGEGKLAKEARGMRRDVLGQNPGLTGI